MSLIVHKRGDTFQANCQLLDDLGNPINLTISNIAVKSQIRGIRGELIADLSCSISGTSYTLTASNTSSWSLGRAKWDIQYTRSGVIFSTETINLDIDEDITL